MTDSNSSEIHVFGSSYEVDSAGNIHLTHTMSAHEAIEMERHINEATNLQDAVRRMSSDGLDDRRKTLRVSQFENQAETVEQVAECSEEMLNRLDKIADAVSE